MKIALFSDIHANLPALEAFLASVVMHQPDQIYCLGDLVGYHIWPNEVIQEIRRRGIPCIAGNYDHGIGRASDDCGCAYKTDQERSLGKVSISYTNEVITPASRAYLRTLPSHIRLEFQLNDESLQLLLVHGSPRKINEYLFEDREEKSLLRIIKQADANILCFGHTHKPYHRILEDHDDHGITFRHAINIGSVGKPKDGDPRGCYALLTIDEKADRRNKSSIRVDFVRFEYDTERAASELENSPLPNEYADMLRKGY